MRQCGSCTLCCRLLPVPELGKPDNTKCEHQCSKGCRIYTRRPQSCVFWNCRWLAGDDTGLRPDRAHYVVDMMPDYVTKTHTETGEAVEKIPVIQIWVEPGYDVSHDPNLRAFLDRERMPGLLRDGSRDGTFICPPSITDDGEWFVMPSNYTQGSPQHSFEEIASVAAAAGMELKVVIPEDQRERMKRP